MRHIAAANNFALNDLFLRQAIGAIDRFKINRLALEQRKQQFLRHRVVAIILFQNLQRSFAGRVAQNHRVRLDMCRRAGVMDVAHASLQVERHGVAHDGEVLVVNGERRLRERREGCRRAEEKTGRECFHGLDVLRLMAESLDTAARNLFR